MHPIFRSLGAFALLASCLIACQPAGASPDDDGFVITAGPDRPIDVAAGGQVAVTLESVTVGELDDVLQSDGLVPLDGNPMLIAAHITLDGDGSAIVEVGQRGGPWEPVAIARPPILPGLVLRGPPGSFARVSIHSIDGARIIAGPGPLQSWVSAVGIEANREAHPDPIGG